MAISIRFASDYEFMFLLIIWWVGRIWPVNCNRSGVVFSEEYYESIGYITLKYKLCKSALVNFTFYPIILYYEDAFSKI